MPRFKVKGVLERDPAIDLWKHTLSHISTVYGRLAYLASLRDLNSGVYRHHGLAATFGRDESARALRESHEQVFREWLRLSLAEKSRDLSDYLNNLEDPKVLVLSHWTKSKSYRNQAPSSVDEAEKLYFYSDLEALLAIAVNASRVA